MPAPRRMLEVGQCATPTSCAPNFVDVIVREVNAVRTPDVLCEPPDLFEIFDRRAAVELATVVLFFNRLGQVGV